MLGGGREQFMNPLGRPSRTGVPRGQEGCRMLSWVPSSGCFPRGAEVLAESMGQVAPCPQSPLLSIFITHQKKKKERN